jgi:putative membrane protein
MLVLAAASVDPWHWHAHPEVWVIFATSLLLYWFAVTRIGPRVVPAGQPVVTRRQVALFCSGVALLWVASDWPVHDISEKYLFSVHMAQHMVMTLVAPPLLLLGVPGWLTRWILRPARLAGAVRVLARPLVAAVVFNATVAITHWPALVNAVLEHDPLHFFVHLWSFSAAMLMWFPVVNRLPEFPTLSAPGRMVYLFFQSVIPNVPAAFLAFADGVVYKFYATVPRPFGGSAVQDQQTAGAIMKVGGTFLIWGIIVVLFFRWYGEWERTENAAREVRRRAHMAEISGEVSDTLTWADVERELASSPPPPGTT